MYTPFSRSLTAWAIMHMKRMLTRTWARTLPCFMPLLISKASVTSPPVRTWPAIPSWNSRTISTNFCGHPKGSRTVHRAFLCDGVESFCQVTEDKSYCLIAKIMSTVLGLAWSHTVSQEDFLEYYLHKTDVAWASTKQQVVATYWISSKSTTKISEKVLTEHSSLYHHAKSDRNCSEKVWIYKLSLNEITYAWLSVLNTD